MASRKTCSVPGCGNPAVARGVCSTHYKRQLAGKPITSTAPPVGSPSGHGRYGILDDDGQRVLCHECGQWKRSVGNHLTAHDMTAAEYRERHGLARGTALSSAAVRQTHSKNAKSRIGSEGWRRFEDARDPATASHSRTQESFGARAESAAGMADRARRHAAVAVEKNTGRHRGDVELWLRQRQEGMAYADIADAAGMHVVHVRRTVQRMMAERGLEDTEAAAEREHRNRVAGQAARSAAARERALEWRELRDRGLSSAEVAERYGVTPSAVRYWMRRLRAEGA